MSPPDLKSARRPEPDAVLVDIAAYVCDYRIDSELARETAFHCLMDSLACAFLALESPACTKLLGPVVPGAVMAGGARVPGTSYELDPVQAAFNIGAMIRWLDFNDTWLAAEWGHPSDNLGAILPVADWLSRRAIAEGRSAAHGARRHHGDDQGARDPGRDRAREQLQPRRPRPRAAGAGGLDRGRDADARRHEAAGDRRGVERVDRRRRAAHLPPRAQHRLAQELGGGRCHEPRRAPRADLGRGRDGLSFGALRRRPGASTTCSSRASRSASRGATAAT